MGRENSGQEDVGGQPRFPGARTGVTLPLLVISGLATGPRQGRATGFDSSPRADNTSVRAEGRFVCGNPALLGFVQAIYGTFAHIMETRVKALTTLLSALEAFSFVGANSAFLNKSQHFTVHLFRPWRPGSARGSDGGPRWFTAVVYPRPTPPAASGQ